MFHICRHFSLRQRRVVHWPAEIQTSLRPKEGRKGRKEGVTDRLTKRVNSCSLTELLFRILQNSRKNEYLFRCQAYLEENLSRCARVQVF